jgi:hypothetical protein
MVGNIPIKIKRIKTLAAALFIMLIAGIFLNVQQMRKEIKNILHRLLNIHNEA